VPVIAGVLAVLFCRPGARRLNLVRDAAIAAVVLLVMVQAAYFFHNRALTPGDLKWIGDAFPGSKDSVTAVVRLARVLLPTDMVMGIYWQLNHARVGHPAGLLGMHGNYGWWYYFPVAFCLKATIPFLVLSLASIIWTAQRLLRKREWRWLILLVPFLLYTLLMLTSPIDIGVRYYLPGYIPLIILSAALLDFLLRHRLTISR